MKNITLIKELNEMARELDPFEKALKEAGIEFDLGAGDEEDLEFGGEEDMDVDLEAGSDPELERIADHWREAGAEMSDDELRDAIGDDLEQLEYSPEEISAGIDTVMSMLDGGELVDDEDDYDMEPDVDERQELEDFEQADEYFGGGDEHI